MAEKRTRETEKKEKNPTEMKEKKEKGAKHKKKISKSKSKCKSSALKMLLPCALGQEDLEWNKGDDLDHEDEGGEPAHDDPDEDVDEEANKRFLSQMAKVEKGEAR
jgi:hypothetical protein